MDRKMAILAAAALLFPTAANATRWVLVTKSRDSTLYVDADAFIFDGATAAIWLKTEYAGKGKNEASVAVEKWLHDCANGRLKLLALTLYRANGTVINSGELPRYRSEWSAISPNSVGEKIHERVCGIVNGPAEGRDADKIDFKTVS